MHLGASSHISETVARDETYLAGAVRAKLLAPFEDFSGRRWKWNLYFYVAADGSVPAKTFLEDLADEPAASFTVLFTRRCHGEFMRGTQHHRWEDEDIYHYKDNQSKSRIFSITEPGFVEILLFGYTGKKEDRIDPEHILRAQRLRDEYLRRRFAIAKRGGVKQ